MQYPVRIKGTVCNKPFLTILVRDEHAVLGRNVGTGQQVISEKPQFPFLIPLKCFDLVTVLPGSTSFLSSQTEIVHIDDPVEDVADAFHRHTPTESPKNLVSTFGRAYPYARLPAE